MINSISSVQPTTKLNFGSHYPKYRAKKAYTRLLPHKLPKRQLAKLSKILNLTTKTNEFLKQVFDRIKQHNRFLPKIRPTLTAYNEQTKATTNGGVKYYDDSEIEAFRRICQVRGIRTSAGVLGHGDEAIAIEIPKKKFNISSRPVLDIFLKLCNESTIKKYINLLNTNRKLKTNKKESSDDVFMKKQIETGLSNLIAGKIAKEFPVTEVLKISRNPVPDFILELFPKNEDYNHYFEQDFPSTDLKGYVAPIKDYRIHKIRFPDGKKITYYSYIQPLLYSKGEVNGKEINIAGANFDTVSKQLDKETPFTYHSEDNATCQYGYYNRPDGRKQILILDYGFLVDKLHAENDEYWCIEDVIKDMEKERNERLEKGLPDARYITD